MRQESQKVLLFDQDRVGDAARKRYLAVIFMTPTYTVVALAETAFHGDRWHAATRAAQHII